MVKEHVYTNYYHHYSCYIFKKLQINIFFSILHRSKYGPNYLKHAQSWKYSKLKDENIFNDSGQAWRICNVTNYHGCLQNYPLDGNLLFHPENFKEWQRT